MNDFNDFIEKKAIEVAINCEGKTTRTYRINRIRATLQEAVTSEHKRLREEIEKLRKHECKISETGWTNYSDNYRKQTERYGMEKYQEALQEVLNLLTP